MKEITFMQIICPRKCLSKDVIQLRKEYEKKESIVIEKLSYKTLLRYFNVIDNIMDFILDDNQRKTISQVIPGYCDEDIGTKLGKMNNVDQSSVILAEMKHLDQSKQEG